MVERLLAERPLNRLCSVQAPLRLADPHAGARLEAGKAMGEPGPLAGQAPPIRPEPASLRNSEQPISLSTFILRRILHTILMLFGVITLTFILGQLVPGDFSNTLGADPLVSSETIDAMRHRFGLDRPWWTQYFLYLRNILLHLDFGESFSLRRPVFAVIHEGLLNTLLLQSSAALVTWALAIAFGVWAAVRQYSPLDKVISLVTCIGLAVPQMLCGLLLLLFAAQTGLFPVGGMRSINLVLV